MNRHASMNRIFRLVWNEALNVYMPAAETARGRGKSSKRKLIATALSVSISVSAGIAQAGPTGGQVTAGSATIKSSGATTTIQQSSQNLSLNWQSFNVASTETVDFVQPNAASIAVNRVLGNTGSEVLGHVNANGQVWLINPNGVLFGKDAQVNVGGLVASTLDAAPSEGGSTRFGGSSTGSVVNRGSIKTPNGGYVALVGNQVINEGVISATLGTVAEVGGSAATLTFAGNRLLQVEVDQSTLGNLAQNSGLVSARGGTVYMTAGARNALLASAVNNSGVIDATSIQHHNGSITLAGGDAAGAVTVGGTVDVSSEDGSGGETTATGHSVAVIDGANIDATGATGGGAIHVGGGWQGAEGLSQATAVTVAPTATLNASATGRGNGGEISVRSDVNAANSTTRANGTLLATGGPAGGNGGRIETSGHWLDVSGSTVKAYAGTGGRSGDWLLDPYNVIIAATGTAVGAGTYVPGGDTTITAGSIATALNGGSNVTITTGTQGTSIGDITVSSAIAKTSGNTDVTLTLQAADSIIVNAPITNTGGTGKLNLNLYADNDNGTHDGVGSVLLTQNLSTGGGSISFGNGAKMTINGVANTLVGGDVYVGGAAAVNLNTAGGAVSFNGQVIIANTNGLNVDTITGASTGGNVLFGGAVDSGDTYAYITSAGNVNWNVALADAKSGIGGSTGDTYLATITSRLENAVASATAGYNPSWLGGKRVTGIGTDAQWRWVAGPEGLQNNGQGLPYFTQNGSATANGSGGTAIGGAYTNWNSGEPNNYNGTNLTTCNGECVLQFVGTQGQWNDLNPTANSLPFVKETNLAPSPLTVNAGSGGSAGSVTFSAAIGSNKPLASLDVTGQLILLNNASTNITTTGTETINGQVELNNTPVDVLYVTAPSLTTVYGATLPTFTPTYSGFVNGDTVASLTTPATVSTSGSTAHVSSAPITVSGAVDPNYLFLYNNGSLLVNPAPLTVTGTVVGTKTYDGTTAATLSSGVLSGIVGSDAGNLSLTQSGVFASANAGPTVGVTATDGLGGSAAVNYTFSEPTGLTGIINPKSLTVSGTTVASKTYDGMATATLANGALAGVLAGDLTHVALTQSGTFNSSNAGMGIGITASDGLTGTVAGNYAITQPAGLTATINPAVLTVSGTTVSSKTYDGTTAANLANGTLAGLIAGDVGNVALTQAGSYHSPNAGTNLSVTAADSLSGSAAGNYSITQPTGLTGSITPASLIVNGTIVAPKTYDGTTAATLASGSLAGLVAGDIGNVTLTQAGTFVSANAGPSVVVTATDSLSGSAAGNYSVTQPAGLTGSITPASLTVSGTIVAPKTYDGTATATLANGTLAGLIAGDIGNVTLTQAGTFVSANAGPSVVVTATDSLNGSAAGNYSITQPTGLTGSIAPASLTVSGTTVAPKTYDGTTAATLANGTLSGIVATDLGNVTLTQAGTFASPNAGQNLNVTAADALSGSAAGNYSITQPTGLTGSITPASLIVNGTIVAPKTYDGTTTAALVNGALSDLVAGDVGNVVLTQTGAFLSPNAGSNLGVTAADLLTGSAAGNYVLTQPSGLTGSIAPATLTVSGTLVVPKRYDATTVANLANGSLAGLIDGDVGNVTLLQSGLYASKDAGTGIAVSVTDSLLGSAASNYSIVQPTGLNGTISPVSLLATASRIVSAAGGTAPAASGTLSGFVGGENLSSLAAQGYQAAWTSTAGSNTAGGTTYSINGAFSDPNYSVVQAASNATAGQFQTPTSVAGNPTSGNQLATTGTSGGSNAGTALNGASIGSGNLGGGYLAASSAAFSGTTGYPGAVDSTAGGGSTANSASAASTAVTGSNELADTSGANGDGAPGATSNNDSTASSEAMQPVLAGLGGRRLIVVSGGVNLPAGIVAN
jgi:filamentous hemagglutinin family protein